LRAQVAENVAEQVAGNDHVELPRIPHNLHRQGIDIKVPRLNLPILLSYFLEDPLPQVMRKVMALDLSLMHTRFSRFFRAYSNA